MGAVGRLHQPPAALHGLLYLVRGLYAYIVILALPHLPVNLRENKAGGGILHRLMGFSSFGSARSASENCKRGSLFMPTPPLAVWLS